MPTAITTLMVTLFVLLAFDPEKPRRHSKYAAPDTGILVRVTLNYFTFISLNSPLPGNDVLQLPNASGVSTDHDSDLSVRCLFFCGYTAF